MWPWQAWQTPAMAASVPGWVLRGPEQRLPGRGRVNSPPGITALNPSPWQIKPIRGTSNPQSPTLFKSARRQLGSFGQGTDKARLSRGKFPRLWSGCCRQLPGGLFPWRARSRSSAPPEGRWDHHHKAHVALPCHLQAQLGRSRGRETSHTLQPQR